jgi:hypothetical protein
MPPHQPPEQSEGQEIQNHVGCGKKPGAKNGKEPNLDRIRQYREEHGDLIGRLAGRRRCLCPLETSRLPGFRRKHLHLYLLGRGFSDDRRNVFVHDFISLLLPQRGTASNWHRRQWEASAMSKRSRPEAASSSQGQACRPGAAACGRRAIQRDFRQRRVPRSQPGEGLSRAGSRTNTPRQIGG